MLSIDFKNIFAVQAKHGISKKQHHATAKKLAPYLKQFATRGQHFHEIVDDKETVRHIKKFVATNKHYYKDIVVIGIGGSALGTICLQKSLQHLYGHELQKQKHARLHVLDNVDPTLITEIQDIIDVRYTLFIVVSKSGTTPEIMSSFQYFLDKVKRKKLNPLKHFIFITGSKNSVLKTIADEEGFFMFEHAPVGGRFAVLSSVGLVPAAFAGINIERLLEGARDMRKLFLSSHFKKNLPFQLAAMQYLLSKKGKHIHVLMPYSQRLIYFADWYRQLLAESIGKTKNRDGKTVHTGITPVKALGVTDQHSQTQLYNEGPNDKLLLLLAVKKLTNKTLKIPNMFPKITALQYMKGAHFNKLIDVERIATSDAYTKYHRPNLTITIDKVDAYHLGQLFMLFEGSIAFLGEFYNIDAFNQPGVELAKRLTREYLPR